jgi:hypothetical protein
MSLKKTAILMVLVMIAAAVIGCTPAPTDDTVYINIATGSLAGTYYPLGAALAQVFNDNIEGVSAQAESTGASLANITLLMDGEVELALIQNDIAYYAFNGVEMYADSGAKDKIRGVAVWYPEIIQIVANADAGISSIEDLRGKKVAVGAPGSGTEANARQILAAHGITYEDLEKADYLTFTEAAENLKDGHIDAAFQTAGIPTAVIMDIATSKDIIIVPFDETKMTAFLAEYPFYTRVVIPAGTYPKQTAPVVTVAVMAMLATHEGVDEDLVYDMVKAMFENLDTIADAHARGADLKLETALSGMPIELHPGAARYYNE